MSQDHNSEHAYMCPGVLAIRVTLQLLWRSAKESVPVLNEGKFYEKKIIKQQNGKILEKFATIKCSFYRTVNTALKNLYILLN